MFVVEINENSLYAIKYDDEHDEFENNEFEEGISPKDEFRRLFNNWSDIEYLDAFFDKHQSDLQTEFYNDVSTGNAIERTIHEANKLEQELISIAENGKTSNSENLENLFKPLDNREKSAYPVPSYQKSKAYGSNFKSWLRIYAIRIEPNVFIVTGGAIKLVGRMEEREHLENELRKIEKVKQYLRGEGILDVEGVVELTLEQE